MVEKVKTALRIDDNSLDDELKDLISACKKDLKISGVGKIEDTDSLIIRAVITYCRANFDPTNSDYDRYIQSYESLKTHLCLCKDYEAVTTNESS